MDDTLESQSPRETPAPPPTPAAPPRPDLDSWRGDLRRKPPAWRRRPKSQAVRDLWDAARPLLARLGEGCRWE